MANKSNSRICLVTSILLLLTLCTSTMGKTIYVDDDAVGLNDGSSWVNAYNHLQDALATAIGGDEIRVAQGIYKPDLGGGNLLGDREATFQLINNVIIEGGFAGIGEPDPNARDVQAYETILSGDIGWVDDDGDNCYHVVTGSGIDETAVLDGFTVVGGNASHYPEISGGGMYNDAGSPTVTNCTFRQNSAHWSGGGMCNDYYANPTLVNCIFRANSVDWDGGGMYNSYSSPTLNNCTFSGNSADEDGGGMENLNSSPTLTNCTFSENSANKGGGGMYNDANSSPALTNCTFNGNSANSNGGGMYNKENSDTTLNDCIFIGNSCVNGGGGMWNSKSNPTLLNCTFSGNSADFGGGLTNGFESSPTLNNCTFSGNSAVMNAGMYNLWDSSPILTNCTFSGNRADLGGGGIRNWYSSATLNNCILWGNTLPQLSGDIVALYSDVQGGWPGEGNINEEPLFSALGYWADRNDPNIVVEPNDPNAVWIDGDYHLKAGSPCINRGDPNYAADPNETDLDGNPRVQGGRIDMGAYEYPFVFDMSDLAGTWQVHHLNSGNAPAWLGWSRFDLSIDDHGNFAIVRGTYLNSSGETDAATTGTLTITSDGILWMPFLVVGSDNRNVHGVLGSSKEFTVTTMDDEGGYNLSVLQKRSGATFSTGDLAGTWSVHGLISGDAPAWTGWYHFDKVINSDGTFSSVPGSFRKSDGDTDTAGGTMTIDGNGIVQVTEIPSYHGRLSDRKDLVVSTMNSELRGYDLHIAMRRSESSFAITDMAGIWNIHGLAVGDAPQWTGWFYGTLAVNADGTSSGILHNSDGETTHIGGTISIANDGVFGMEGFSYTHGVLSSDKDLIVLVATDSFDNHKMLIGTRAQPNASFVDYVPIDPNLHDIKTFEWTHGRTGLYIGAGKTLEPGSFWPGLIDDVRIYDRVVTP